MSGLVESFSGIRGTWGESFTPEVCRRYGYAFGQMLLAKHADANVVIGRDTRPSGPGVFAALVQGLAAAGIRRVIDLGISSTPMTEQGVRHFRAAGGVILTASHNQPEDNGIKFLQGTGGILSAGDAAILIHEAGSEEVQAVSQAMEGATASVGLEIIDGHKEAVDAYLQFVLDSTGCTSAHVQKANAKVLLDINGGANGEVAPALAKKLGLDVVVKGQKPGEFWRLVEPKAESLAPLAAELHEGMFACAFDCDADRMEIVLPTSSQFALQYGPLVSGQYVVGLVVQAILSADPKAKEHPVITNDATSQMVKRIAEHAGTTVEEVEVGETNVVSMMHDRGSKVGGEGSNGGSIVAPGQCRDGLQALAVIIRYLADHHTTLDQTLLHLPHFHTVAIKAQCLGSQQARARQGMIEHYRVAGARVTTTGGQDGGVKAWVHSDAWVWWRASKTEAGVFRIIADAKDRHTAEQLLKEAKDVFARVSKV